ncbi:hypothetical protein NESM_000139000 [Novymonas esmeraldas]|uniref:Uncharacterized protein n=1 Tax=Novymonas esmeraldas TaxID=1808958 RepID=A0AAW0F4N7_9TRYP
MWAFEAFAEGLTATSKPGSAADTAAAAAASLSPPRHLYKKNRNNDLFDAHGKLLDAAGAHLVTTWRTHHAFSGRCALVCPGGTGDGGSATATARSFGGPRWAEQARAAYQDWSIAFRLRANAADEPHILLSVAPAYFPNLVSATGETLAASPETLASLPSAPCAEEEVVYDRRVLETPLIWEEPYALSVECTPHGVFLWSDHWSIFGKKIADRCLELRHRVAGRSGAPTSPVSDPPTPAAGEADASAFYDAALRLRWSVPEATQQRSATTAPTLSVDLKTSDSGSNTASTAAAAAATAGTAAGSASSADEGSWRCLIDLSLPLDDVSSRAAFRPYVTLMEGGDAVELL